MSATTIKKYKITFILDLRESEDDSAKVLDELTQLFTTIGGTTTGSEDLGMRDFVRAADRRFTQGHYLEFYVDASPTFPAALNQKLKLDKRINRIFTESV